MQVLLVDASGSPLIQSTNPAHWEAGLSLVQRLSLPHGELGRHADQGDKATAPAVYFSTFLRDTVDVVHSPPKA